MGLWEDASMGGPQYWNALRQDIWTPIGTYRDTICFCRSHLAAPASEQGLPVQTLICRSPELRGVEPDSEGGVRGDLLYLLFTHYTPLRQRGVHSRNQPPLNFFS